MTIPAPPHMLASSSQSPLHTAITGVTWIIVSSVFTTYSTTAFLKFHALRPSRRPAFLSAVTIPDAVRAVNKKYNIPQLLTSWRFGGSFLLSILSPRFMDIISELPSTLAPFFLPAVCLTLANLMNVIALDKIGISATYTTKCAIPVMTVLIQAVTDYKNLPNLSAIATLPLIVVGIALSNWNSPNFDVNGFSIAMVSCVAQSMLNVCCKTAMMKTNIKGVGVQRNLTIIGLLLITIKQQIIDRLFAQINERRGRGGRRGMQKHPPTLLTFAAVASYHFEYSLSFAFLSNISSVTFAITDAIRRLCIIVNGRLFFGGAGGELTTVNKVGILLAVLGALLYAVMKE